jgi:hypothetical protein
MRLLLDECVPRRLRRELTGHDVRTVTEAGWAGLNGALLRAADDSTDALITVDQGIAHPDLQPLVPALLRTLGMLQPGSVVRVPSSL